MRHTESLAKELNQAGHSLQFLDRTPEGSWHMCTASVELLSALLYRCRVRGWAVSASSHAVPCSQRVACEYRSALLLDDGHYATAREADMLRSALSRANAELVWQYEKGGAYNDDMAMARSLNYMATVKRPS